VAYIVEKDAISRYLDSIKHYKSLSMQQEYDLYLKIKKGSKNAEHKLVNANLRFVVSVAVNYLNQGMSFEDLISEGNCGLIAAAHKFDGSKNFKFISYAVWWIRQSILKALAAQSRCVNIPTNTIHLLAIVTKARDKLKSKYNREPTIKELSDESKLKKHLVESVVYICNTHQSLDTPLMDDSSDLINYLVDPDQKPTDSVVIDKTMQDNVKDILGILTPIEKTVIKLYYGIDCETDYTLEEIGKRYNLTRERIRQIKSKAMQKLKTRRSKVLRALIDCEEIA
jgi:RNA polymerase primary sigma factor